MMHLTCRKGYSKTYEAHFCYDHDQWMDPTCPTRSSIPCVYCDTRPARPFPLDLAEQIAMNNWAEERLVFGAVWVAFLYAAVVSAIIPSFPLVLACLFGMVVNTICHRLRRRSFEAALGRAWEQVT